MDTQSKKFKDLQSKWDNILKEDGFEDIEQRSGELKEWSSKFCRGHLTEVAMEAKRDYYQAAGRFLYDHKFKDALEKRIWALHGEGMSIRSIVKAIIKEKLWPKGRKNGVPNKRAVHETIQSLVLLMKTKIHD